MSGSKDELREKFEAWARLQGDSVSRTTHYGSHWLYDSTFTEWEWRAWAEAYKAGSAAQQLKNSEASKWIPVEHELLVALDKGTWDALGAWAEKYGIGEALPNKWKEAKAYAIEWVLALPSPPKPSKDGQNG